ncbi:Protein csh3 [Malassezia vespertilionis]|uniref:Shr3p n=1 Tax=Malassezia vespertilionis TaxID=2020962 RepID=A0A2N1JD52_9BASI|nr:Protein csh3 [Malassezia vespertilionis]PKI84478.1 hypothetical protein MVES_001431 [Malassezia vespertilionis]WFD06176.1 Protein csh3 [Malassezia vespertilionis]
MGFRSGFVLGSIFFIYGVLFVTSTYDIPLIFHKPLSLDAFGRAEQFYLGLFYGPNSIKALLHAIMGAGVLGLALKVHRWTLNDKYFGMSSIVLYVGSLVMYLSVILPNIRALVHSSDEYYLLRAVFEHSTERASDPTMELILEERVSLVQVISATNLMIAAALFGVLLLQGGEWYAIRQDRINEDKHRRESIAKLDGQRTDKSQRNTKKTR